jgi:hypothetical protein
MVCRWRRPYEQQNERREKRIRGDGLFVREKDKAEKARGSLIHSNEEISGKMKWKRWECWNI